jgi:hypothetical protein
MLIKKKTKAQSLLEYVVLLSIIGAALGAMQFYFRRGIQGVVKVACDQAGNQRDGGLDYDFNRDWKIKGNSNVTNVTSGSRTNTREVTGAVTYGANQTDTQTGVLSYGVFKKED